MLSVSEARQAILEQVQPAPSVTLPLSAAQGLVLSHSVTSTVNSPPYHKALMDGFAVRSEDVQTSSGQDGAPAEIQLVVQEEITAGDWPKLALSEGVAARIMTGAPLPDGADSVVMLEQSTQGPASAGRPSVLLTLPKFRPGQNVLRLGEVMKVGETILSPGTPITPSVIGLLAELGQAEVSVAQPPTVTALSTGNELVPFVAQPEAGQIRNSNGPMLAAQIRSAAAIPQELGIARDREDELRQAIERGLEAEILLLSGGVSAGDLDLVPGVLKSLGVREVFHKVKLKPGKPLWFGIAERQHRDRQGAEGDRTLVFGLPGNPVSSFVCFELFVRPAINKRMGLREVLPASPRLPLAASFSHAGGRPAFLPGKRERSSGKDQVRVLAWLGSADLRGLAGADVLVQFPVEARDYKAGEEVPVLLLDNRP